MDFIEIIVIISVIWSVISSITSKNKKKTNTNTRSRNTGEASVEELFSDLSGFLQGKLDTGVLPTQSIVEQMEKIESPKIKDSVEKFANKSVPKVKGRSKSEFTPAFTHTEHFDESKLLHSPIPTVSDDESLSDSPIYSEDLLNPSHIREAILLNEILNKPKALQTR